MFGFGRICSGCSGWVAGGSYLVGGDFAWSGLFGFVRICSGWVAGGSYLVRGDSVCSGLVRFGRICSGVVRGGLWAAPIWSGAIRGGQGCSGLVGFVQGVRGGLWEAPIWSGAIRGGQGCSGLVGFVQGVRGGRRLAWSVPCSVVGERRYHGVGWNGVRHHGRPGSPANGPLAGSSAAGAANGVGFGPQIKSGATDPRGGGWGCLEGGWVLFAARYPRQARV